MVLVVNCNHLISPYLCLVDQIAKQIKAVQEYIVELIELPASADKTTPASDKYP